MSTVQSTEQISQEQKTDKQKTQRISIIVSRCLENPKKFRLIQKKFQNGAMRAMFPSKKIEESQKNGSDAAHLAATKCPIYGEITFSVRFPYVDEYGEYDVFVYEGFELDGLKLDAKSKEKIISLSRDQILQGMTTTDLTKEVLKNFHHTI